MHSGDRAHAVDVIWAGRLLVGVFGRRHADEPLAERDLIDELDRARLPHHERDGGLRVDDHATQRQDGQLLRQAERVFGRVAYERLALLYWGRGQGGQGFEFRVIG